MMKAVAIVMLALLPGIAMAQFRCSVNGQVVYQETSCVTAKPLPKQTVRDEDKTAAQIQAEFELEKARAAQRQAEGYPLSVASDSGAKYWVMEKSETKSPVRTIVTRRVGSSGTTWSRREFNCVDYTARYLGTGDSREAMDKGRPDPKMSIVLPGSIADYVGREACTGFNVGPIVVAREGEAERAQAEGARALAKANSKDDYIHLARAETAVKRKLRDPDSATFKAMRVSWLSGKPIVCGQVNAKNGFGGFSGFTRLVAAGQDVAYLESEMASGEMEKVWSQFCGYGS